MKYPGTGKVILLAGWLIFITACTPLPHIAVPVAVWQARRAQLSALQAWEIRAAIAVNTADDGFDARLHWQQQPDNRYHLRLHGPLGQGTILIDGDPTGVVMHSNEGKTHRANTPESLIYQVTGVEVPLSYLKYWIRGLPVPTLSLDQEYFTDDGALSQLDQAGWHLEYTRYTVEQGFKLPVKLYLKNNTYRVKIVISQWHVK